jgi:hypothetical protein
LGLSAFEHRFGAAVSEANSMENRTPPWKMEVEAVFFLSPFFF